MSRWDGDADPRTHGFPRVSGDEPYGSEKAHGVLTFSPRERG